MNQTRLLAARRLSETPALDLVVELMGRAEAVASDAEHLRGVLAWIADALAQHPDVMADQAINQCAGIAFSAAVGGMDVEPEWAAEKLAKARQHNALAAVAAGLETK